MRKGQQRKKELINFKKKNLASLKISILLYSEKKINNA